MTAPVSPLRHATRTGQRLLAVPLRRPSVLRRRRQVASRLHDLSNRLEGLAYHIGDRHPRIEASDQVLTQRVRSTLGPLERQLDVPRLHVTVHDHLADVRGVVGTEDQAAVLLAAVSDVSGIDEVTAQLHIGYGRGDTRPSEGRRRRQPSAAWRELVGSVHQLGEDEQGATALVTTTLRTLLDVLPDGERQHVRGHLPADVLRRVDDVVLAGRRRRTRSVGEFVAIVAQATSLPRETAEFAVRRVLATLRDLVPEEVADITAVLPGDLKDLWREPLPAGARP